jgi:choline dehydrogenase-like flavoprotein
MQAAGKALYGGRPGRRKELGRRRRARTGTGKGWFLPEEYVLVDTLACLLVPSDDDTPGAREVDVLGGPVVESIQAAVSGSIELQEVYARGLFALDELARRRHGSAMAELSSDRQADLLTVVEALYAGRSMAGPLTVKLKKKLSALHQQWTGSSAAADLFPVLRNDVLGAFYTSKVSWIWLGYDGPPMPHGYPNLLEPRPPSRAESVVSLQGATQRAAAGPAVHTVSKTQSVEVVVIGCGAGGAVVAKELGEAGVPVVVLEAGRRFDPYSDYLTDRQDFELAAAHPFDAVDRRRDLYTKGRGLEFSYNRSKGVGGSTLKYAAMSPRLHESDFRAYSEDGVADDWPISYETLEPYYARVEYELGISGPDGADANPFDPPRSTPFPTPPHDFNLASLAVKRGAGRLGLHMVREPVALPSRDWQGRPACVGAGTCHMGCAINAKSSMDATYVPKAEATGRVEIRSESTACEIVLDRGGKARSVVYFDAEGHQREIHARAIVVAGNAVETPRLLLLSSSSQFPHGLANSSGLVGKYFTEHLAVFAFGLFAERIDPWRGTPTGGMIQDYYATSSENSFARGWTILVTSNSHWPFAIARRVPGWGAEHKAGVQEFFGHAVCLASIGEQLPSLQNRVVLDPMLKDGNGVPVPCLINAPGENDRAMIGAITGSLAELLEASGATRIWSNQHVPGMSSHYFGTCRMGTDAASSVVDSYGRTHDVPNLFIADGSVFVTGGAVNPALTISALATRTAEAIARAFQHGML